MEIKIIVTFIVGFIIGIIAACLHRWRKNNILYKPGTGKVWEIDPPLFDLFNIVLFRLFLDHNVSHKFYRKIDDKKVRKPNELTEIKCRIEYWD
jgi:hypothetical protein